MKGNKKPLLVIFLTVFIDLVGFGIIIPLSPYLASQFGASQIQVGMLQATYSFFQFLFSPFWGRVSDKYGRRPVILISLLGCGIAHLIFAFAPSFWILFLARSFAGFFGGNLSAASAYIADITPAEERSKSMGLIGAAFGLGFIFGPVIGTELATLGTHFGSEPPFGISFSAVGAAAICVSNFVFAYFVLPETRKFSSGVSRPKQSRFFLIASSLKKPVVGHLMISLFLIGLAMAHMESMLFLFVRDRFEWTYRMAGLGFAFVGVVLVFTQGFLIRKVIPKLGERFTVLLGFIMAGIGMLAMGFSQNIFVLAVTNVLLALGYGMANPSLTGSVSLLTNKDEQGVTLGVNQSLAALGRIIGPVSGGWLYQTMGQPYPFAVGGCLILLGFFNLWTVKNKLPNSGRNS